MMRPTVLFIDDDRVLIKDYAEATKSVGLKVHCEFNVDKALDYMKSGKPADAIVWDMMMIPGKAYDKVDTESGLATGRRLYEDLRRWRPEALFVLFTHDRHVLPSYDNPQEHSYAHYKLDMSARTLASFLAEHLLSGEKRGTVEGSDEKGEQS